MLYRTQHTLHITHTNCNHCTLRSAQGILNAYSPHLITHNICNCSLQHNHFTTYIAEGILTLSMLNTIHCKANYTHHIKSLTLIYSPYIILLWTLWRWTDTTTLVFTLTSVLLFVCAKKCHVFLRASIFLDHLRLHCTGTEYYLKSVTQVIELHSKDREG